VPIANLKGNRMRFLLVILLISSTQLAFAQVQPTPSSKPLPTIQATKNIDVVLGEKVQSEIAKNPAFANQTISAASHEQVITLEGSVDSKEIEEAAIKTAKSVKGVKSVKSQMTIKLMPTQ
jgi:osmotically-inducible protein OsmY